ncbi:MAG: helix-turn-helix transcriptional regulator [Patescibacteria group bacterium]
MDEGGVQFPVGPPKLICRKLDMDRSYMSAVESGKKNITLAVLERLTNALSVSVNELLK